MEENLSQPQTTLAPEPPKENKFPKFLIPLIILALLVGGYLVAAKTQNWWPFQEVIDRGGFCLRPVTARNIKTGEIKTFTRCMAPRGWEAIKPEDETINPALSGVEGWQTYRNQEFGFEVKYPGEWTSSEERNVSQYRFNFSISSPKNEYHLVIGILTDDPKVNQAFIFEGEKQEIGLSGQVVSAYVWKQGYECYGDEPNLNRPGGPCSAFYIPVRYKNSWYFIQGSNNVIAIDGIYAQILSTFKFIK